LQDEYENFVVVAADNQATRILQVTSARAETTDRVRGDVKNHVRKGGWSQQRYSRRRDKELLHYAKEINEVLGELVRQQGYRRIVLLGSQETLTQLRAVLSTEVADRVVGQSGADLREEEEALVNKAYDLFFEEERAEESRLWERIQSEYLADGLAAVGATAVLDALKLGRVSDLLVTRDAEINGTQCQQCENVVHGTPTTCQICGAKAVFPIDLVDELVRQAQMTSASVEFSDPIEGLTSVGHVAALLRY
jgi:peptide subunit release factor 1 (eRF1)